MTQIKDENDICCPNNSGYAYSNESLAGNGGLEGNEVDEIEVFKVGNKLRIILNNKNI